MRAALLHGGGAHAVWGFCIEPDMLEQIQVVLDAEAAARGRLDGASQDAQRLTSLAAEEARLAVRRAQLEREATAQAAEEALVRAAAEQAQGLREDARAKLASMRARAEARLQRAVEAVVACVLGEDEAGDGR